MKKIFGILITGLLTTNLLAQNPLERKDTLIRPHRTDSADFKNSSYRDSSSQYRDSSPQYNDNRMRKDSMPLDDRKPKHPPKGK